MFMRRLTIIVYIIRHKNTRIKRKENDKMENLTLNKSMPETQVKIRKIIDNSDNMKAIISLTLEMGDFKIAIHDIKVIKTYDETSSKNERYFVAMPSRRSGTGGFLDIIHPIDFETRQHLEDVILSAYFEHVDSL